MKINDSIETRPGEFTPIRSHMVTDVYQAVVSEIQRQQAAELDPSAPIMGITFTSASSEADKSALLGRPVIEITVNPGMLARVGAAAYDRLIREMLPEEQWDTIVKVKPEMQSPA